MAKSPRQEASDSCSGSDKSDSVECPTCGRTDFKNTHGMKIHHSVDHGESIAGVSVECNQCGDSYRTYPTLEDESRFCSQECKANWQSENRKGENHPNYNRIECECEVCGETVHRQPSQYERMDNVFCSQECHREYQSIHQRGENHHNYKPKSTDEYGPNWYQQRRKALERDNYECQFCGISEEQHQTDNERGLEAHHIIKERRGGKDHPDNLITVCRDCHNTLEQTQAEALTRIKERHVQKEVDDARQTMLENFEKLIRPIGEVTIYIVHHPMEDRQCNARIRYAGVDKQIALNLFKRHAPAAIEPVTIKLCPAEAMESDGVQGILSDRLDDVKASLRKNSTGE